MNNQRFMCFLLDSVWKTIRLEPKFCENMHPEAFCGGYLIHCLVFPIPFWLFIVVICILSTSSLFQSWLALSYKWYIIFLSTVLRFRLRSVIHQFISEFPLTLCVVINLRCSSVFGVGELNGAIGKAPSTNRKWEIQNGGCQTGSTCVWLAQSVERPPTALTTQ